MQQATAKLPQSAADLDGDHHADGAGISARHRKIADDNSPVQFVPTEYVLVTAVTLGARHAHQRLASLPFALEDRLAQPIEKVHFALGPKLGANVYLAAAVDEALMQAWLSAPHDDGREDFKLVPDIFILPVPPEGTWNIATLGDRVIVRLPDTSGFATQTRLLGSFHAAAGCPDLILCLEDGPVPDQAFLRTDDPIDRNSSPVLFDLRQGRFAARKPQVHGVILGLARTATAGLIALSALAALDSYVLSRQATGAELALAAEVEARAPGVMNGREAVTVIEGLTARGGETDAFLKILSEAGKAWPSNQPVQLRQLGYSAAEANLELLIEASSIAELEGFAAGLETAGIEAELGASTAIPGGAEGRIRIGTLRVQP